MPTTTTVPIWHTPLALVLAGGLVMGAALGIRHAQGLFQLPLSLGRDWPRETFALAIALQNLLWGLAQPFTGMLADRYGALKVIVLGLLCYALGLYGMAHANTPLQLHLSAGVLIGLGLSGTAFAVIYGALSRMLALEQRGWALGLAGAIGGLGQFLLTPASQLLIEHWQWDGALLGLALLCVLLLPLAGLLNQIHNRPNSEPEALSLRHALSEALQHRGFWLLNLGFLACGFQLAFIATHLPAYLLSHGLSLAQAVTGLALIALSNVFGTYICGYLGGVYRRKYVLTALYLIRALAIALLLLLPLHAWSVYVFCVLMGFLWLGTVPLTNGILAQIFGVRYLSTLFGLVFLGHQLGAFFGVWLGGYLFDRTGSYHSLWLISLLLSLAAAVLHYPIDDRGLKRPAATLALAQ